HPDSGPFHAALHHFSLKYVSIPAKKCLAQRKNFPLPVTLGVFRYTLGLIRFSSQFNIVCRAKHRSFRSAICFYHIRRSVRYPKVPQFIVQSVQRSAGKP
ncbi:MAG: hypothetical protein MR438_07190, partial [Clostridiales bacterium]|nr:hypothetical protein [Clostridiales bacterium]